MKQCKIMGILMLAVLMMSFVVSCSDKNDENDKNDNQNVYLFTEEDKEQMTKLIGTSWICMSYKHGNIQKEFSGIITFADKGKFHIIKLGPASDNKYYSTNEGSWRISEGKIYANLYFFDVSGTVELFPSLIIFESMLDLLGSPSYLSSLTPSSMTWIAENGDERYFTKTAYIEAWENSSYDGSGIGGSGSGSGSGSGGSGGSGGSYGEAPYVTSFTFTATQSSITVKFMCNERPTSATVKYGTSSATTTISSSISGKQVSAKASGLKAGTKYYFKCTVSNSYGSSTSDTYPAITNY